MLSSRYTVRDTCLTAVALTLTFALSACAVTYGMLPIVITFVGFSIFLAAVIRPDYAIIIWLVGTTMIPEWTRLSVSSLSLEPSTLIAVPILAGFISSRFLVGKRASIHVSGTDIAFFLGIAVILFQYSQGWSGAAITKEASLVWLVGYVLGRCSSPMVSKAFVIIMSIAAVWGLLEFAFSLHVFANWFPASWHHWNEIQQRAGFARSEAAFGHAIAYGASLAMAIPFAQRMRYGVGIQVLLCGGVLVSLSRGPMVAAVATLALTAVFLARGRFRWWSLVPPLLGGYAVLQVFSFLYSDPSSQELVNSSYARELQFDYYFGSLQWLTGNFDPVGNGVIDSTPLRLAANFGIIVAVLLLSPIFVAVWNLFTRRGVPASVALTGQIAVLVGTSLITQWAALVFFLMGMVVNEQIRGSRRTGDAMPWNSLQTDRSTADRAISQVGI